jgi:replicative DNA helicase
MLPMVRALRSRGSEGNPIPTVFQPLAQVGAHLRRGQLVLIAAAPGGMKSAFTLDLVIKSQEPSAYISADTDSSTLARRAVASLTGKTTDEVSVAFDRNTPELEGYYRLIREKLHHISWDFDKTPDLRSVEDMFTGYRYMYASNPNIFVVDNLRNFWGENDPDSGGGGGSEHERASEVIETFKQIAAETGACGIVLHHVTGQHESGTSPIPMSGILGKVSKEFRLILTLRRVENMLNISVVKNTSGPADADGYGVIASVPCDPSRMLFNHSYDPRNPNPQPWRVSA